MFGKIWVWNQDFKWEQRCAMDDRDKSTPNKIRKVKYYFFFFFKYLIIICLYLPNKLKLYSGKIKRFSMVLLKMSGIKISHPVIKKKKYIYMIGVHNLFCAL